MSEEPKQAGFELNSEFYAWHLTDKIKDLQLIDHFAQMPPADFFSAVEDDFDRSRTPILTAMMATSIRHIKPNWSLARVIRMVEDISMSDVTFFEGEEEEDEEEGSVPLDSPTAEEEDTPESSEKSSEPAATPSKKSSKTQPSSGTPGSDTTSISPSTETS